MLARINETKCSEWIIQCSGPMALAVRDKQSYGGLAVRSECWSRLGMTNAKKLEKKGFMKKEIMRLYDR